MDLVLVAIVLGNLTVTSYRSVPEQTDSSPFYTSTGERVKAGGVAVSRDLLCGACRRLHRRCLRPDYPKKLHYGDWLYVDGYGFKYINDVMGATSTTNVGGRRHTRTITNQIDMWVRTPAEEKAVGFRSLKVHKIKVSYQTLGDKNNGR